MAVTVQTTTLEITESTGQVLEDYVFIDITGDGLQIGVNVVNLTIKNCVFKTISGNAIRFKDSGNSDGVTIENNTMQSIGNNGVLAGEPHTNVIIQDNTMQEVALDPQGSAPTTPHHGIYTQCPDVIIRRNVIDGVVNENGNCITVRSSGLVEENTCIDATKYGVSYYSDHPGAGSTLTITGNKTYVLNPRGINVSSAGDPVNFVDSILINKNFVFNLVRGSIGVDEALNPITVLETNHLMKQITEKEPWIGNVQS